MYKLVLLRHGQSAWNLENRFTGWTDVDITELGRQEAISAGKLLLEQNFKFDIVYTSVLKRAIHTMAVVMDELDQAWVPVIRDWHLNERHYGALQGLDKAETAAKHGEEQVKIWRRAYAVAPPPLTPEDSRAPGHDRRYKDLKTAEQPLTESLADTVARFVPYWTNTIAPQVKSGKNVIIVAHGNSLRALVKHLDGMSEAEILELNIPTSVPLVYELDANLKPIKHYYLGDPEAIRKAQEAVANQGKKK